MNDAALERLRRDEFPLTSSTTYLNHAGTGPVPVCHLRAATACLQAMCEGPLRTTLADTEEALAAVRSRAARLLHCTSDDVAILSSTVQAVNLVPLALEWAPGDEVVVPAREYPSVTMALTRLRAFGVVVRTLPDHGGRFRLDDLEAALTARTRLVALSLVGFATGWRAPVAAVAALCRPRGIWLVVDAIQAVGAIDVDAPASGADILAAQGYKHLLSGYGVAPCYCSARARDLMPPIGSRMGVSDHLDATRQVGAAVTWSGTARRFEPAVPSLTGLHGMAASLDLILGADPVATEARIMTLLDHAADALGALGFAATSPMGHGERSSLLSLRPPTGLDVDGLARRLAAARISVSVREGALRIAPHLYNTHDDIGRLVEACGSPTRQAAYDGG